MRKNYRILIIEDQPKTLNKIKQICEDKLFAYVDAFTTSVEAMRSYLVNDYDLIISDINLSGETKYQASDKSKRTLDGIEMAQYLLNYKPTALIFLTAYSDIYQKEFDKSGVVISIQKPIHEGSMLNFVIEKEIDFFDAIKSDAEKVKQYINNRINRGLKMINAPEEVIIKVKERRTKGKDYTKVHKISLLDIFCIKKDPKGNYLNIVLKNKEHLIETNLKGSLDELYSIKEFETSKNALIPYKPHPSPYVNRHHDWVYIPEIERLRYIGDKDELSTEARFIVEKVEARNGVSQEAKKIFSHNREV